MRKETRQRTVDYGVFIANDGQEFDTEKACVHHEKILSGERKVCPECEGCGYVIIKEESEDYHTGVLDYTYNQYTCNKCGGKGYLEKTTIWK